MGVRRAVLALGAGALVFGSTTAVVPALAATAATIRCTSAHMTPSGYGGGLGSTIYWTASSTTCPSPQYKFFLKRPGGSWIAQTAYGGPTWNWNTAGFPGGVYWVEVWARNTGSAAQYESYWTGTYVPDVTRCSGATLSTADTTQPNITPGASILFNLGAAGCVNPDSRVWLQRPGGAWQLMRDYTSATTWTWDTTGYPNGTYQVGLWVRQHLSGTDYDAYDIATHYLGAAPNCATGLTLKATPPSPTGPPGQQVQLTSSSICSPVEYEYWIKWPGRGWTILLPYSTTSNPVWSTVGYPTGTYELGVWVKPQSSTIKYSGYAILTYRLGVLPCRVATIDSDLPSPQQPGYTITFLFAGFCMAPSFEVWLKPSPSHAWVRLRGYTTDTYYRLDTVGAPRGPIEVGVWARQDGSTSAYDAYAIITYWLGD